MGVNETDLDKILQFLKDTLPPFRFVGNFQPTNPEEGAVYFDDYCQKELVWLNSGWIAVEDVVQRGGSENWNNIE